MVSDLCSLPAGAPVARSSQGIGLAIARGLAEHGPELVLNGRDEAKVKAAAQTLRASGNVVSAALFDVTEGGAIGAGIEAIERSAGAKRALRR